MSVTLSARVPEETMAWLRREAENQDRSVSEIVNRALDEHVRCQRFPGITFSRAPYGQRRARLFGGPKVWSVILVARGYAMDPLRTSEHFSTTEARIRIAFAYHEAYPKEIDTYLERLEELELHPELIHPAIHIRELSELPRANPPG